MKKLSLLMAFVLLSFALFGCNTASLMTTMTGTSYSSARILLVYSEPEVIRDQSKVATIIVPDNYGLTINGLLIKELEGPLNPALRTSAGGGGYIVDLLPGVYELVVTYDANTAQGGEPTMNQVYSSGGSSVSAGANLGSLISWIRTSETSHTLNGGEVFAMGLKLMTISGEIDLYPVAESDRAIIAERRNQAQFSTLGAN